MEDTRTMLHAAMPALRKSELKTREPLPMFSDAFCEENLFRDERHEWCRSAVPPKLCPKLA